MNTKVLILAIGSVYLLKDLFFYILVSAILAIGVAPIVNWLSKKLNTAISSMVGVILLFYFLFLIIFTLVPFFDQHLFPVILNLDESPYISNIKKFLINFIDDRFKNRTNNSDLIKNISNVHDFGILSISEWIINIIISIFGSIKSTFSGVISFFIYVPIVTYFFLKDKQKIIFFFRSFLSNEKAKHFDNLTKSIYKELNEYLKKQLLIVIILSIYYSLSSYFCGLFFILGIVMGLFSMIPYVGFIINLFLTVIMSMSNNIPPSSGYTFIILFLIGFIIENAFLIPKIFFNKIHPLYLLIFMGVFQNFVNFSFLFLAMPICVTIGVIFRYFELFYKNSINLNKNI